MFSKQSFSDSQTVSTQMDGATNFSESDQNDSALSYGSETDEDIDLCDIKPTLTEFFVKIETDISEPVVCKTEVSELSSYTDIISRRPKVVLQRIEFPLQVPKTEPVSDTESSQVNNFSPSEMDLIEHSISEDKTYLNIEESEIVLGEVTSILNTESHTLEECFIKKRKKMKKKNLTIPQMYEIIQNNNGFFNNKKKWMTKKVLKQLPDKDKIFLSNIFKKFMKRNKFKKKK